MGFDSDFAHKEELIEAAIDELDRHGYDKASLNRILARAGMSKGQLYHHFRGKEDLYFGLIELMIARKRAFFAARPLPDPPPAGVFETLREQLRAGMQFARTDLQLHRLARSFLRERGRPIYDKVMKHFTLARADPLLALIDRAHKRGELTTALPRELVTRAIVHLFNGAPELLEARTIREFEAGVDDLIALLRRAFGRDGER